MIVTYSDIPKLLGEIEKSPLVSFDVETTGLTAKDRLFSVAVGIGKKTFYFNFIKVFNTPHEFVLGKESLFKNTHLFTGPDRIWSAHNATFDLSMLLKEGVEITSPVWCTQIMQRHLYNQDFNYSLDNVAQKFGYEKSDEVKEYIKKEKLYTQVEIPGKKNKKKLPHFDQVPLDIMARYAKRDGEIAFNIAKKQRGMLLARAIEWPDLKTLIKNEMKLPLACARMMSYGIKVDMEYTREARKSEEESLETAKIDFLKMTGVEYSTKKDSLIEAWTNLGLEIHKTDKGNPTFDKNVLKKVDHPVVEILKTIKSHEMRIGTYYSSLEYENIDGIIYASINPAGTSTGRFSYNNPNLQNIPKREETPHKMRKCFVPREDFDFFMIDYDQQELKILFDLANERNLIERVLAGEDAHQVTADLAGITRTQAKTINFGLIYGMGLDSLAQSLEVEKEEARDIKARHLSKLKGIGDFVKGVQQSASIMRPPRNRGFIHNWAGRRLYCPTTSDAYKMVNHLIQSSAADVCRFAITRLDHFLKEFKSRMLVQIHDEILFEIHKSERHLIPEIKSIMEEAYIPRNGLSLTASVEWSDISWFDKKEYHGPGS